METYDPAFTDRVLSQLIAKQEAGPQIMSPTPAGGQDEVGNELVPYDCHKCGIRDHISPYLKETYDRRRILCLPCREPHRWKWHRDAETGERFLKPLAGNKQRAAQLGELERRLLETQVNTLIDRKLRRDFLVDTILKHQLELSEIEPQIVKLRTELIPQSQEALTRIETDPELDTKQYAADVAHQITLLMRKMAKNFKPPRAKTEKG